MERLRRVSVAMAVILLITLFGSACSGRMLSDYRQGQLRAVVLLSDGRAEIKAEIISEAPTDGGDRSVRMTFISPDALLDVTLCDDGERYITYKDMRIDGAGMEYLFEWLDMIFPVGELRYMGKGSVDGIPVYNALVNDCSIYLDRSTCLPLRIEKESRTVVFERVETDK